ncbi:MULTISPECIES: lycopene cyclase domain-containing protein [unclassified Knoellia]|uniref:lycopene cyclase domain-containing protein n=1 Tax=Knoellia altitudinis TaxID=3404795 RepID=UPI0036159343
MTLTSWSYVAMLGFCLIGTIPLELVFGLGVLRQVRRLALTIGLAAGPFLLWDLWATRAGHWNFDPDQTLQWRVAGIPLEEVGFFVVIPLAAILTYEAVRTLRGRLTPASEDSSPQGRRSEAPQRESS